MATWLELRCENRGSGEIDSERRCWSDDNAGPHGMACDDQGSILAVLKDMHQGAIKSGWLRKREGWYCPACRRVLGLT